MLSIRLKGGNAQQVWGSVSQGWSIASAAAEVMSGYRDQYIGRMWLAWLANMSRVGGGSRN
jgi:hypothetical protein